MKHATVKLLIILLLCAFGQAAIVHAQITAEQLESVVRIFAISEPDKDQNRNISTGTGFVITADGLILTNNHVVASEMEKADHPYTYIVTQKRGNQILMYPATFVAQDPNADLAVIRCSAIKATPFQFLLPPPHLFEEVYSLGFPSVSDPTRQFGIIAMALMTELKEKGGTSIDITDEIKAKPILDGFFVPTAPNGKIEKVTDLPGFVGGADSAISVVEHSCNIRGGNSGGPLLNPGGQVLGVVGDAPVITEGAHKGEQAPLAIRSSQVQKFLQANGITNCVFTNQAWIPIPPKPNLFSLIVATAIAIAVAIVALVLGLIKTRRKTGFTTILTEWKTKGGSATELVRRLLAGHENLQGDVPGPQPKENGKWRLAGRTSAGKTLQLAITEDMFAKNGSRLILGRSAELCDLVINDDTVSLQHAEIRKEGAGFLVADRNSSNGTAVNGLYNQKPFQPVSLKPGDTLTLGEVKLDFAKS